MRRPLTSGRRSALNQPVRTRTFALRAKPERARLAQRVDRHYDQLHSLKAGFTENYAGLGMQRTESGTLLLVKPGRMKWEYSSPPGKIFLLDGKYAWFYTKGDAQVQRIPAKELDDLRSPLRFLLGHTNLEKEMNNLTAAAAANGEFHTHRPAQGPGKARDAADADGDGRGRDHRDRDRRGRRRADTVHVYRRATRCGDSAADVPVHSAAGSAGGGCHAAGVRRAASSC